MKIAMMTNNYKPFVGGVPISIERLSEGLRKRGHEVTIIAPENENADENEDVEDHVIRYRSYKRQLGDGLVIPDVFAPEIRKEFERTQFDLIHVHHPMLVGNVAVYYSKKYKIPLIFTYHTKYEEYLHYIDTVPGLEGKKIVDDICSIGKKFVPWYMKKYLKKCSMIFAPSEDMFRYVQRLKTNGPVQILPTGLPKDAYMCTKVRGKKLRNMLLEGDKRYLLCTVSRLEKEKNLYYLVDAIKELYVRIGDIFRFVFVGDGTEREALEKYSKKLGLEGIIRFAGCVPNKEVTEYLAASDIFLFASKSETQGIVIAEAMAAALPIVALDACGVRDLVKTGENGFLVQNDDLQTYVENICYLLKEKKIFEKMSNNAFQTAKHYRDCNIAQMAEIFYEEAVERERGMRNYEKYEKKTIESVVLQLFKTS